MKNLLLVFLLALATTANAQNILRVNNTLGVNAPYATIAAAVAAAGVNDIIQVEGSITNYGGITITKKVSIIGPGFFLNENAGLQANLNPANFGTITLNTGASGSVIQGLQMTGLVLAGDISNFTFTGNYVNGNVQTGNGNGTNHLFNSNYIFQFSGDFQSPNYTNVLVTNNYIGFRFGASDNGIYVVSNNVIALTAVSNFKNAEVKNNIFFGGSAVISLSANSILKNNISTSTVIAGADPINVWNASASSLFVGLTGNTTDTQWRLKSGSPATGAGEGGIDCGMYGGSAPYRPSGIQVGQPTITNFSTPTTVPQNGTLNVKVSAKVN